MYIQKLFESRRVSTQHFLYYHAINKNDSKNILVSKLDRLNFPVSLAVLRYKTQFQTGMISKPNPGLTGKAVDLLWRGLWYQSKPADKDPASSDSDNEHYLDRAQYSTIGKASTIGYYNI
jgi:hypothetical protein